MSLSKADQLKRHAPLKEKPFKSKEYLSWFHNQGYGCLVCGNTDIEAHHIMQGNRGRQDDLIVPLCLEHHRGKFSPHGYNAKEFHNQYSKEMQKATAEILFNRWKHGNNIKI